MKRFKDISLVALFVMLASLIPASAFAQDGIVFHLTRNERKCLDVKEGSMEDGAEVILWDCHNGDNQIWDFNPNGQYDEFGSPLGTITSRKSGKCIDAEGGSTEIGTRLIQWYCHGGENQTWKLVNWGPNANFQLVLDSADLCIQSTRNMQFIRLNYCAVSNKSASLNRQLFTIGQ